MEVKRPKISQAVIDGFATIIDAQDKKGLEKYGRSIDDAVDEEYCWKLMALEEMADYSKYLVREIRRLRNALDSFLNRDLTSLALLDVNKERSAQNEKWGLQRHDYPFWLTILVEEVGEVAQAMQKDSVAFKESDASDLYKELIQVAAVAVAIAEQVMENERPV